MYKKILVFICCVVLVSETVNSQVVSVEGDGTVEKKIIFK